jgi:WD40 repeat protein
VKVLDVESGKKLFTLEGHTGTIISVAFSPDGKLLATGSLTSGKLAERGGGQATMREMQTKMWDVQTGKELFSQKGGPGGIFSPDGKRLATGGVPGPDGGQDIKVLDAQTGQELATFKGSKGGPIRNLAFSPDGALLASTVVVFEGAGPETRLKLWHAETGKELINHKLDWPLSAAVFSPNGKYLAFLAADAVTVWDAQTGKELLTLKGHVGSVNCVTFSPDGKRLATSASDKTVKLWDTQTGQELLTLEGHSGHGNGVAFSPDGQLLAAGSAGGTVKIWNATPRPEKK